MVLAVFLFEDHSSKKCFKLILGATSYYHRRNQGPVTARSTTTTCKHALSTSGGLRKISFAEKSPGSSTIEELFVVRDNCCSWWEFVSIPQLHKKATL